jgi:hypothetical protein
MVLYGLFYTLPGECPVEVPWPRVGPKLYGSAEDLRPAQNHILSRGLACRVREIHFTPAKAATMIRFGSESAERIQSLTGWDESTMTDIVIVGMTQATADQQDV